jgi:hypothetical protein
MGKLCPQVSDAPSGFQGRHCLQELTYDQCTLCGSRDGPMPGEICGPQEGTG